MKVTGLLAVACQFLIGENRNETYIPLGFVLQYSVISSMKLPIELSCPRNSHLRYIRCE